MAVDKNNFRRLLLTFEALADLGPQMTAGGDFGETARAMLRSLMNALGACEGVLFGFSDQPAVLSSITAQGFLLFPEKAIIPLLPRQLHALITAHTPQDLSEIPFDTFLSSNGNVAPELFKCIAPLRMGSKLVGLLALGKREGDAAYENDEFEGLGLLTNYIAMAVHNHNLSQSLAHRVSENLRLLASIHNFYDSALEAFATAIDVKHVNIQGHSLRVGRYAAAIAETMGMAANEISGLRAAGYLHDIGKVAVDKHLFAKPRALDPDEFREMADHTVVGHQIVSGVEFPWPRIPEIVRSHHERGDGSGYPDRLRMENIGIPVRIIAVADSFDAMTSERPYRHPLSVGEAACDMVRNAPHKYDPAVVQAFLVQIRRDAVSGRGMPAANPGESSSAEKKSGFLDGRTVCNIAPTDVDHLASILNYKLTNGRVYSA